MKLSARLMVAAAAVLAAGSVAVIVISVRFLTPVDGPL